MYAHQYDFLEDVDVSEIALIRKEIEDIRQKSDNVRKGLFSRYAELTKIVLKQQEELDRLRGMLLDVRK